MRRLGQGRTSAPLRSDKGIVHGAGAWDWIVMEEGSWRPFGCGMKVDPRILLIGIFAGQRLFLSKQAFSLASGEETNSNRMGDNILKSSCPLGRASGGVDDTPARSRKEASRSACAYIVLEQVPWRIGGDHEEIA